MAIYHQDIADIELNSGSIFRNFLKHSIGLGDAAANRFGVRVFRDGDAETLSSVSCQGFFRNANGENIALTSYGTVSGNEAYVTLPQACYTVEGRFTLAIKLVGGGVTGTMRIIDGVVDNTNTDSPVAPTGSVPTYQEILSVFEQMQTALSNYEAKVTEQDGKISDLKSILASLLSGETIDFNNIEQSTFGITTSGKWNSSVNQRSCAFLIDETTSEISITANAAGTIIAFLNTYNPVSGESVDFSAAHNGRIVLDSNEVQKYAVSSDMNYLFVILKNPSGEDRTPVVSVEHIKTDTTLTKQYVPADGKAVGDAINAMDDELQDCINKVELISEESILTSVTSISPTTANGIVRQTSGDNLIIYDASDTGATAARRICFLNGQNAMKSTGADFEKTLDPGTYIVEGNATGFETTFAIAATYSTFANAFTIVSTSNKKTIVTFTAPVMIGFTLVNGRHYGSEQNPTYITFAAKQISAKDIVARAKSENAVLFTEQSLTSNQAEQARKNIDTIGNDTLYKYNFYDALSLGSGSSREINGITYTRNADNSWIIVGTATSDSFNNIIGSSSTVPRYIIPGRKYRFNFNGGNVPIQLFVYKNGITEKTVYSEDFEYTFPLDMTGLILRFEIESGSTYNTTVKYTFVPETFTSVDNYYTYNTTVEKTEHIYNNSYTITTTPDITTDTNGWLQAVDTDTSSETGKTDMTPAIMAMLTETGYCHLGEGIFYVSGNIDMPSHSMLCGCGDKTTIRLLASVENGYVVSMNPYCTIKDLGFSGSYSAFAPTTIGYRDAIRFAANHDGADTGSAYDNNYCSISNVFIRFFSGSGILCHNTGNNVSQGLYATNVLIRSCYYGINIDKYSEFNKFTNICTWNCYYGCVNNGGNNVFTACTFHATNTGFYIDGTQPNAAHGTINGCTFCHIGSNLGSAFKGDNIAAGFIIADSQFWYNSIDLTNCRGVVFDGCYFGRGITSDNPDSCATINISGGNLILFCGCVFNLDETRPPKINITNNSKTVFSECYGSESGNKIHA